MFMKPRRKIQYFTSKSKKKQSYREYLFLKKVRLACVVLLGVMAVFMLMYWAGNGFSFNVIGDSDTFYVNIDSPVEGEMFYAGENIAFTGGVVGDTLKKVSVWDTEYNVGVPCTITTTKWGVTLHADDFSPGIHTLAVQAQGTTGCWSPIVTVQIEVKGSIGTPTAHMTDLFGPFAPIFRPIEDLVSGVGIYTEEGTGDNDLNGDNIDDSFQRNPISPRYNPFNMPMTFIIVMGILAILVYVIGSYSYEYMRRKQEVKAAMAEKIALHPARRQWYLNLKSLANKKLRDQLSRERARRKSERSRLYERISNLESEKKRIQLEREKSWKQKPVKIMITPQLAKSKPRTSSGNPVSTIRNVGRAIMPRKRPTKSVYSAPRQVRSTPIRGYNRGMNYGRSKKKKQKKK